MYLRRKNGTYKTIRGYLFVIIYYADGAKEILSYMVAWQK